MTMTPTSESRIADLCRKGDICGMGKMKPCTRVLMCGKCDRPLVPDAPTCGDCWACRRLIARNGYEPRVNQWA